VKELNVWIASSMVSNKCFRAIREVSDARSIRSEKVFRRNKSMGSHNIFQLLLLFFRCISVREFGNEKFAGLKKTESSEQSRRNFSHVTRGVKVVKVVSHDLDL